MNTHMLYNGNCLDELRQIKDKSIDLILTDPPYIISRETNFNKGGGDEAKYGSISMDFGEALKKKIIFLLEFFPVILMWKFPRNLIL